MAAVHDVHGVTSEGRLQSRGATWRDPLDWPFLLSGVGLRLWCSLWAGIAAAHAEWRSW
jgi:hypothetical protein